MFVTKKELNRLKEEVKGLDSRLIKQLLELGTKIAEIEKELNINQPRWINSILGTGWWEQNDPETKLADLTKTIGTNLSRLAQYLGVELTTTPERTYYKKKRNKNEKKKAD